MEQEPSLTFLQRAHFGLLTPLETSEEEKLKRIHIIQNTFISIFIFLGLAIFVYGLFYYVFVSVSETTIILTIHYYSLLICFSAIIW